MLYSHLQRNEGDTKLELIVPRALSCRKRHRRLSTLLLLMLVPSLSWQIMTRFPSLSWQNADAFHSKGHGIATKRRFSYVCPEPVLAKSSFLYINELLNELFKRCVSAPTHSRHDMNRLVASVGPDWNDKLAPCKNDTRVCVCSPTFPRVCPEPVLANHG